VAALAVGGGHSCVVGRDGRVACWGRTDWGQGGSGLNHTDQRATRVEGLEGVVEVATGGAHTCARTKGGEVYCWGLNQYGQLGDGTTLERDRPVKVEGLSGVEQLALGGFFSCARTGGRVQCWGARQDVPNIDFSQGGAWLRPRALDLAGAVEIAAGGAHACARLADSSVRCWGLNDAGQLGDGSTNYRAWPVPVRAGP
jgi:alpha-tubulin suppressor-like RCC1 family protein